MNKKRPSGFVAKCLYCKGTIDFIHIGNASSKELGKLVSSWLKNGYVVEPRIGDFWAEKIGGCRCKDIEVGNA